MGFIETETGLRKSAKKFRNTRLEAQSSDQDDTENSSTDSDLELPRQNIGDSNVWCDEDSDVASRTPTRRDTGSTGNQNQSPLKRKRPDSAGDTGDDSDTLQTSASLSEYDLADLGNSEDDLDIERLEGEKMIQEEEDRFVRESNFHVVDDSQPFAYAPDDESDHSHPEEFWIEDFDALVSGGANFESQPPPKFELAHEESQEVLLEEEFFLGYLSSDADQGSEAEEDADEESPFGDDDDRVGWECFFSNGDSDSESVLSEQSGGSSTDEEATAEIIARRKAAKANPTTPAKIPGKTNLTSCLKQTHVFNDATPSKSVSSTPIKLNTSHKPPMLGTWTRDARRATGIIDGMTTHSPVGPIKSALKVPKKKKDIPKVSDAVNDAMTSLDDIMYTNDFLVPQQKPTPSKFDKPIHVGAFRKGQQRSTMIKEGSFREEWYHMTSRNKTKPGRTKATPVLGVASESLSRKEKRRRRKIRAMAGTSIGGSTFGGSIDETSDNEPHDGIERAGLGLGVPVESLFLFHDC